MIWLLACTLNGPLEAQATHLGLVQINTQGVNIDRRDPEGWTPVDLSWTAGGDSEVHIDQTPDWSGQAALKLRGNSSRDYDKKQYTLEFRDSQNQDLDVAPFGLPEEEDWVLHAPYSDKSLMRNHLMFRWSRAIDRYAPRSVFVELYLQDGNRPVAGDYRGVYLWVEKIKRDGQRVDVDRLTPQDTEPPEITGGYLLRRDWIEDEADLTTATYGDELLIEYPKAEDITAAQRDYLESYLNAFEATLSSGEPVDGYIDLNSFADHLLMMEMSRNVDAYVLSTTMHKPRGGLLTMGPIWDFNGSLGNADYFESWQTEGWHFDNPEFPADNPQGFRWYEALLEDPAFRSRVRSRWEMHRAGPWSDAVLTGDIRDTQALLGPAAERNFERWPVLGRYVWPNDAGAEDRQSYSEEVEYLETWLQARVAWMDQELAGW